jgi:hypothetical protein
MDEHDDDLEPEVENGVELEVEDFPIVTEEEETTEGDIDPDKSEI